MLPDALNGLRSLLFSREGSVQISRQNETEPINPTYQQQECLQTLLKFQVMSRITLWSLPVT